MKKEHVRILICIIITVAAFVAWGYFCRQYGRLEGQNEALQASIAANVKNQALLPKGDTLSRWNIWGVLKVVLPALATIIAACISRHH
jgi:hypothetical protein